MITIDIEYSKSDMQRFNNAIKQFLANGKKTPKDAVMWSGVKVLDALSGSTKIAPKTRKIVLPKTPSERKFRKPDGTRLFYAIGYKYNGARKYTPIWAVDKQQARFNRAAVIRNRHLAKQSWRWAKTELFNAVWKGKGSSKDIIKYNVRTKKKETENEFSIRVTNRIDYIQKSFKRSGKKAVDKAILRAAKGMERQIEKQLFKRVSR
jgi:hypothetical protein